MTTDRIQSAAQRLLKNHGDTDRCVVVYVPGRIEVVGKHTDYAGGQSLSCAVCRSFCAVAVASDEPGVRLRDIASDYSVFLPYQDREFSLSSWTTYPTTVVRRIVNNFGVPTRGVHMAFSSDIPRASGMSSSSAFVITIWLGIISVAGVYRSEPFRKHLTSGADVSMYLASVENGSAYRGLAPDAGVGTKGGSQDHAAILFSSQGVFGHYAYRPLRRLGKIRVPRDVLFVIGASGVRAQKTKGALNDYNRAVRSAEEVANVWRRATDTRVQTMGEMIASDAFSVDRIMEIISERVVDKAQRDALIRRVSQFVRETQWVVPTAIDAIVREDWEGFGKSVSESQRMADELLQNQVPETRFLVRSAVSNGALAASSFGAGFGGSVWALVRSGDEDRFLRRWRAEYGSAYPSRLRRAFFFPDRTGPGTFVLGIDQRLLLIEPEF